MSEITLNHVWKPANLSGGQRQRVAMGLFDPAGASLTSR
jgi:ABC-type sugar transport system ATPase subunit